jgi:DNA repair exonuclease SbcCD ATPase subunit
MATIVEAEIKLTAEKAIKQVKELKLELEEVKKELKANEQTQKKAEKSSRSFGKALGAIGKAGGVIFLLQKAFELLKGAIESNQQVADTFKVVMGTISQVFTEIAGVLVGVYNNITATSDGFDALGKVVSGIIDVALTPFKLIWDGIKLKLLEAQLAWEESFFGSGNTETIDRLNDSIKQTRQDIGETLDVGAEGLTNIVENFGEAVSEVGEAGSQVIEGVSKISIKSIADNVKANVQLKKASERARIENQGLIEQYDRQAEQQRQIRDNDLKNIDDRIKANDELKKTLEDQKEKMLENVDLMIQQAQAQFDLTGKEEDFLALQSAKNEKKAVEAQIEGFLSEQKSNATALEKEKLELELSSADAKAERQTEERNFNAEMEENEVRRIQKMIENLEIERGIEEERLRLKVSSFEEGTQAQQDAQNELDAFLGESARSQVKLEKDLGDAKMQQTKKTLGDLATIVGKNSKFGKAIAIAQAIQDTYAGADKALAQGGIYGFIGAAAVIATGIANVKKIASTKPPKPPAGIGAKGSGDVTPAISASTTSSLPPSFNIVGTSGTNQLADVLASQGQQPIQAYVVSNDVSTAQELDRNIIEGASIG